MSQPSLDALRYVDYALNIHDHGVFGLSGVHRDRLPAVGNANAPLYPAFLALALKFDPALGDGLRCTLEHMRSDTVCATDYSTIVALQDLLIVGALVLFWFALRRLYENKAIAWLSAAFAFTSTKLLFFANHLLTEILVLFLFAALIFLLSALAQSDRTRSWGFLGIVLGALALTRPEYMYLAGVFTLFGACAVVLKHPHAKPSRLLIALLAFAITVGPWLARNQAHFGQATMTGGYGDVIIAYRSAYNAMRFDEWLAAFVYWLPAHGEQLAKRLFPPSATAKLGTDPDSYLYLEGTAIFEAGLVAVDGDRDRLTGYLIRTQILEQPLRHAYASIPLAWRGILAGKYLAVVGLPCLLVMLGLSLLDRQWTLLFLLSPALVMIGLYAAVSVSVPRYNVYLIYYYGLASAWALVTLFEARRPA